MIKLINGLRINDLKQHKKFKLIENNKFKVLEDNYINKQFVYQGDEFRIEEVSKEKLESLMELIKDNTNKNDFNVCFYHLDDRIINTFDASDLLKIANK